MDSIARNTVRVTLKKELKPWLKRAWSIPPRDNAAFTAQTEVDVYCSHHAHEIVRRSRRRKEKAERQRHAPICPVFLIMR